jgi:plasmid stability protein
MSIESKKALNIRDVPSDLRRKCKIKAAMLDKTLKQFVEDVLKEATVDVKEDKPTKGKRQ